MIPDKYLLDSIKIELVLIVAFIVNASLYFIINHLRVSASLKTISYLISHVTSVLLLLSTFALVAILAINLLGSIIYG